jgi:hypothetical protein
MILKKISLFLLLVLFACGDDGEGKRRTFTFVVYDGEIGSGGSVAIPLAGATVEVYSSVQAWLDEQAPLKTFATNTKGAVSTFDIFPVGSVVFAEKGIYNNWPTFINNPNLNPDISGIPDVLGGSATVFDSFLSDFESVKDKHYLLTDVRVNNVSTFNAVSACSKDNFIKLQRNAKFLYSESTDVCSGATASQEYDLTFGGNTRDDAATAIINSTQLYQFNTNFPTANGYIYVKPDFSQIWFYESGLNETVTIYTKQP